MNENYFEIKVAAVTSVIIDYEEMTLIRPRIKVTFFVYDSFAEKTATDNWQTEMYKKKKKKKIRTSSH